jgi:probable phosphoglycerate mutase
VSFTWIPREQNKDADALSNDGMDGRTIDRMLGEGDDSESVDESVDEVVDELIDPTASPSPGTATGPWQGTPTRIVLVRHGVTDFTVASRLDGRGGADPSLNTAGQAQAAAAGRATAHLLGGAPARLLTSSLARARQTGAAVAEAIGATPLVDADWDEQDFGDWDGASIPDLVRDHPQDLTALRQDPAYARPGGESHDQLAARVVAAFERVVAEGGTAVVVCHRKPIMCVLAHVLGIPHDKVWRLAAAPGSLTALEVWPDGNVSVAFTNRT